MSENPGSVSDGWVIVTPARNEAERLPALARSLARQAPGAILRWIVVDDGSTDSTGEVARAFDLAFPVTVVGRENVGGLRSGSPFAAFRVGARQAWALEPSAARVVKIDADIVLHDKYMAAIEAAGPADVTGGVIVNDRERSDHVRGALKSYNRTAWELIDSTLPNALGWDVLDEVLLRMNGMECRVVPTAKATVTRRTGSSEGFRKGRIRAGVVSRWTGYHPLYFAARLARYALRRPPVIGSIFILWGYATAGRGPYDTSLRRALRHEQRERLGRIARKPSRLRTLFPGSR